ncbi:MAG: DUF3500 domain-containing protein [Gammaproteobacteria bacterium]|nr:DUF3500 domain-containing protein [Gammaproteobacteria bacterium]
MRNVVRIATIVSLAAAGLVLADAQERIERFRQMSERAEQNGLAEPFRGVGIGGQITPNLFSIESTGVSTQPVRVAAQGFLDSLTPDQHSRTLFSVDDPEWRKWMNQHFYLRQGVGFDEMDDAQRSAAISMLRESLSTRGLQLTRDIMRLNHTLGELNDNNFEEYGEWLYWITVMGEPSASEPWGWQLDGHHVIINYFVLGDQVVMSPVFVGSEPVTATSGKFAGVEIMQEEQDLALAFVRGLSGYQREQAVLKYKKDNVNNLGEAFRDNINLDYAGISGSDLSDSQRDELLALIELYVGNMREGHAEVKMTEVAAHIENTWFAWIGGINDNAVFYYRILSPVILIEFDHQRPANLRHIYPPRPNRQHVHAVIRTPNGNDYGKDLLRQHYEKHAH